MGNIFNKSPKHKITSHDQAILDMKVQRDKLTQYQKKVLHNVHTFARSIYSDYEMFIARGDCK
jgi:hypothetical protein